MTSTLGMFLDGAFRRVSRFAAQHGLLKGAGLCLQACCELVRHRPVGTLSKHAPTTLPDDFDRRFQVNTRQEADEWANLSTVETPNWRHGIKYEPVDERIFRQLMASFSLPHADFSFIDLGCGKGKAMFLAADYAFRSVIGVEYSRRLHAMAQQNIRTYNNPQGKCRHFVCLLGDAAAFPIPQEPCLLFLFNPFDRSVMEAVAKNIVASMAQRPRRMLVLYYHAVHADVFRQHGFAQVGQWRLGGFDHVLFAAPSLHERHTTPAPR